MGIIEQLLKSNEQLLDKVNILLKEGMLLKEMVAQSYRNDPENKEIVMRFSGNDIMNFALTAKAMGIKQRELQTLIDKGLFVPCGVKKRNFRAKDVVKYIRNKNNSSINEFEVIKKSEPHAIICNKDMVELFEVNKKT